MCHESRPCRGAAGRPGLRFEPMAATERDYYEVLGVGRTATESEIKKAFRGLARTLHPDVSEEPDAEARFREVVEAYEVLSKSETRELYDRYGHAGLSTGGFTPTSFDLGSLSDLFSAFFGDDLFGVTGRTRRSARRGRRRAGRDRARRGRERHEARGPVPGQRPVRDLRRQRRRARHRAGHLRDVPRRRPDRARLAHGVRRVHPHADVSELRRHGPRGRAPVRRLRRSGPRRRGTHARDRGPARHPRRPADQALRRRPRRRARRAVRRPLRPGPRPPRPAFRARGQRHRLARST